MLDAKYRFTVILAAGRLWLSPAKLDEESTWIPACRQAGFASLRSAQDDANCKLVTQKIVKAFHFILAGHTFFDKIETLILSDRMIFSYFREELSIDEGVNVLQ